ncbi:MAG: hypothetical protein NT069_14070 [Planctomycetota bacterium]|nr:hypothetical protein [Planctomycetota bacterium]
METMTTRKVNEIPLTERTVLEALLGEKLSSEQQVFVMAYTPGVALDPAMRAGARQRLIRTFEAIDRNAEQHGVTGDEVDAAIEEAMAYVRPRTP